MSKDTFEDIEDHGDPERRYEVLGFQGNERGYFLSAIRMPYYEQTLEFVQVDFPDGTSAYFRLKANGENEIEAGPFGGGYSWAAPKYVVKAAGDLLRDVFNTEEETVDA